LPQDRTVTDINETRHAVAANVLVYQAAIRNAKLQDVSKQ
jgi:hypothetical protein